MTKRKGVPRAKLMNEYKSFKRELSHELKSLKPEITIFGSVRRRNLGRLPHDIDVQIDVRYLSDKEFGKARRTIQKVKRKYPDVDPVLYSWSGKRLPSKTKRRQLRWQDKRWEEHAKI